MTLYPRRSLGNFGIFFVERGVPRSAVAKDAGRILRAEMPHLALIVRFRSAGIPMRPNNEVTTTPWYDVCVTRKRQSGRDGLRMWQAIAIRLEPTTNPHEQPQQGRQQRDNTAIKVVGKAFSLATRISAAVNANNKAARWLPPNRKL